MFGSFWVDWSTGVRIADVIEAWRMWQQAAEAHNILSYQMQSSFGAHQSEPGRLQLTRRVSEWDQAELTRMGYKVEVVERTYSPITAIWLDQRHGTLWGGASEQGDDYGIAW